MKRRSFKNRTLGRPAPNDWLASAVVFIIALPLSLGIALASGAPPAAGLITAMIGGLVVGALDGAPLTVSGPAAGLSALVYEYVGRFGLQGVAFITVFAGLMQLGLGVGRVARFVSLLPRAILEGVLSAIGFIIALGQLYILAGMKIPGTPIPTLLKLPASYWRALAYLPGSTLPILFCGVLTMALQFAWPRVFKRWAWLPGALPAVALATLVSLPWKMPRVEIAPFLPSIGLAAHDFGRSLFAHGVGAHVTAALMPAAAMTLVACAETLLTARATDLLIADAPGFAPADLNRQLVAHGAGNIVSGIAGGIPITAVMVRSSVNVTAGAQTRWSTMLHGLWMALCVALVPFLLTRIPLTALAGALIIVGARLLKLKEMLHELRKHPAQGALWAGTAVAIVATDMLKGMGLALAAYVAALAFTRIQARSGRRFFT